MFLLTWNEACKYALKWSQKSNNLFNLSYDSLLVTKTRLPHLISVVRYRFWKWSQSYLFLFTIKCCVKRFILISRFSAQKNNLNEKKEFVCNLKLKIKWLVLQYSIKKIKANPPLLYSTLSPNTSSDSPSAKSKGVRLVSANLESNQTMH